MSERPTVELIDLDPRVPEPSAALRDRVQSAAPVALRRPMMQALRLVAAWALWSIGMVIAVGVRRDHAGVPADMFAGVACAWVALVGLALVALLLPPRGQVLPSITRARFTLVLVPLLGIGLALGVLVDAPGMTAHPVGTQAQLALVHCLGLGLVVALPALAFGWSAAHRLLPVGAVTGGAAIGATAGALGALVLHLICPVGGALHLGVGHAGGIAIGAVLGAIFGAARR